LPIFGYLRFISIPNVKNSSAIVTAGTKT